MHSVRSKLLAIVAVCLVPMAVTTIVFSWAADQEIRADAREEIQAARRRLDDHRAPPTRPSGMQE